MKQHRTISRKVSSMLLAVLFTAFVVMGAVSVWGLYTMKGISVEGSRDLGQTAAEDAEKALEELAVENLQTVAVERAFFIEEKFALVRAYVRGIAAQAQDIYEHPENYPDRKVALPERGSSRLAAQLLWSEARAADAVAGEEEIQTESSADTAYPENRKGIPVFTEELLKLGNIQDLLVQFNASSDMVSSTYVATESGWVIQADYIAFSKYEEDAELPMFLDGSDREWYRRARSVPAGQIVYSDIIQDVHSGNDCIVCACPVYYEGKVAAVAGVGSYLETVHNAVLNTTIGETGYAFLVNKEGQVMVSGRTEGETAYTEQRNDLRESANAELAEAASRMVSGDSGSMEMTLDGREVCLAYAPLRSLGWSVVTVIDVEEVIAPAKKGQEVILALTGTVAERQDEAIRHMLLAFVAMMAAAMVFICLAGTLFSRKLTDPIRKLADEVAKLDGGNLDCRIQISTGDEVEDLGNAFNRMAARIQSYVKNLAMVTAEKERIRTEIAVASKLQADMLPKAEGIFTDRKEFTLAASMNPAKGVGGDFYDFFLLDADHLALVIADVSGKGIPAALFMVVSRTLIKGRLTTVVKEEKREDYMSRIVEEINESLCADNRNGMFVTAWIGVLTLSTGELVSVNAGHCRPLIRHCDGTCTYETARGGLVLAGMEEVPYRQSEIRLNAGEILLLYTDGVTEATSLRKELYGEERLRSVVQDCGGDKMTPEKIIQALWRDVDDFQRGAEQFDDITMLAVAYHGSGFAEKRGRPDIANIGEYADFAEDQLEKSNVSRKIIAKVRMAVDEIYANICYYSGASEAALGVRAEEHRVLLYFEDNGIPYNPLEKPDPDPEVPAEQRKEGGLGIYLVKKRMDQVTYEYTGGRNRLTLECRL